MKPVASRRSGGATALSAVALGLLSISTVVGSAVDSKPDRPVEMRAGYRVLEADFHTHTRYSDGFLSPMDLVDQASRRGLDVIGVSEHNQVFPAKVARAYSRWVGGPTVVICEEITTHDYHLLAVGIEDRIDARKHLAQVIVDVHSQGGLIGPAHPTHRFGQRLPPFLDTFDLTELMHPIAYQASASGIGSWTEMRDFYTAAKESGNTLAPLGDSDYHFGSILGLTRTYVFSESDDADEVVNAIRAHRTVVFDLDHRGYGDPRLVAALEAQPLTPRPTDYGYEGVNTLDRVFRVIGFVGMLGLIVFRTRMRKPT